MDETASNSPQENLCIGLDIGTSGCRAIAIDADGQQHAESSAPLTPPTVNDRCCEQNPWEWWAASCKVLTEICAQVPAQHIRAIVVDGTSGTLLLTDKDGNPLHQALMYNDARCIDEAARIAAIAPADSGAHGATSSLAKLLYLQQQDFAAIASHALHQADWIAGRLCTRYGFSDENNCLKLGYDVIRQEWPAWFDALTVNRSLLPQVVAPGTAIGTIDKDMASHLGLPDNTQILAGTTDGVAAFLASGAINNGEAVTSLGSTLVLKVLSDGPVFAPEYGVYSHRLNNRWLVGGASNVGGAVLLQHFTPEQLDEMTAKLQPDCPTGLDYYPLPAVGERFPVADPGLAPCLTPRPEDDVVFFQAILEGIARIEAQGYRLLADLGAPYPDKVYSVGGGATNQAWCRIRENRLGIPVLLSEHQEAAYGAALLASRSGATIRQAVQT